MEPGIKLGHGVDSLRLEAGLWDVQPFRGAYPPPTPHQSLRNVTQVKMVPKGRLCAQHVSEGEYTGLSALRAKSGARRALHPSLSNIQSHRRVSTPVV